jgi:hypothetical protein
MSLCVYMSVCLYVCICVCLHVSALFLLYSKLLSSVGYCLQLFLENSDHYLFNHFFLPNLSSFGRSVQVCHVILYYPTALESSFALPFYFFLTFLPPFLQYLGCCTVVTSVTTLTFLSAVWVMVRTELPQEFPRWTCFAPSFLDFVDL